MYAKYQRVLEPKHALRVLNELRPGGITFVIQEKIGVGWIASVDLDGKTFIGNGPNLSSAKQQASEKVLRHIMRKQLAKLHSAESNAGDNASGNVDKDENTKEKLMEFQIDTTGREESEEPKKKKRKNESAKDKFPWECLISFALYKLFEGWHRDEALSDPTEGDDETTASNVFDDSLRISVPFLTTSFTSFGCTRLPMKKIPEDAKKEHPVMMLNQLKPNLEYNVSYEGYPEQTVFKVSVEVNGQEFIGQGRSKKDAKKMAAEAALVPMGIVYEYDSE